MFTRTLALLVGLLTIPVYGQESEDDRRHVRFVTLGELPPWRDTLIDGIRVQNPPEPGEMPPKPLYARGEILQDQKLDLRLDWASRFVSYSAETGEIQLGENPDAGGENWLDMPVPGNRQSLVALYRDHTELNWFAPRWLVVPDDLESVPLGSMHFINVSDRQVQLEFSWTGANDQPKFERVELEAGKTYLRKVAPGGELFKLTAMSFNGSETIFENKINVAKDKRIHAFLTKDGRKSPRKPVRFVRVTERAPELPKLPRETSRPAPAVDEIEEQPEELVEEELEEKPEEE